MSYYIYEWGDGSRSLYKRSGEEHCLLAHRLDSNWKISLRRNCSGYPEEYIDITKEEAAMILFQAKEQA